MTAEDLITEIVEGWISVLDLPGIEVVSTFMPSTNDEDPETAADTAVKFPYRYAQIRWYMPVCRSLSFDELEPIVVHELAHVLLGPIAERLKAGSDDYCEHATENVCRSLLAVNRSHMRSPQ